MLKETKQAAAKYAERNPIKTASLVATVIGSIVAVVGSMFGTFLFFDERYTHAAETKEWKTEMVKDIDELRKQNATITEIILLRMTTRKTILEMKQASNNIQPDELVELNNIKEFLNRRMSNHH